MTLSIIENLKQTRFLRWKIESNQNTRRNEDLYQNPHHHGDGSVLPSNEFPEMQSCPYCLQKHLPVYTTCASPPQLVRPHRTYLTPDSPLPSCPFSPLGPEGRSIPAFPLNPISPENVSFILIFSFSSRNGNGINDKAGRRWRRPGFRLLSLCSGDTGSNPFLWT